MVLLIGFGNTLRRDDGAGPELVGRIAARFSEGALRVLCCHQLTPELAATLCDPAISAVVFVDAAVGGSISMHQIDEKSTGAHQGHHVDPAYLLHLARWLYGRAPDAWMATVPGDDFGMGEGLSPACREAVGDLSDVLEGWLARRFNLEKGESTCGSASGSRGSRT